VSQSLNGPDKGIPAIFDRFSNWIGRLATSADQLFCVWVRGWGFVWFGIGDLPSADETLSAFVGKQAIAGKKWALIAEKVIDFLMTQKGHCRRAIARDGQD
jgi:hypothetical protein